MRKLFLMLLSFFVGIFLSLSLPYEVFAKKGKNNSSQSEALTVVNNKGEKVLNGSVLDPKEDEMFILLHSVLVSTLRGDLENVSIVLSSITDPSKRFIVPKNAVSMRSRKINKKAGKYLSVNLFNIKTPSGITIPPSALQKDNYKLRIVNDKNKVDVSTQTFNYQTPVLIVGMASQKSSGFVTIEDLSGNQISDSVVGLNENGSFFTEVRADMVKPNVANKGSLMSLLKNQLAGDGIYIGVIHVVSDKDLYAIAPLENNPDVNGAQIDDPLVVNEGTTLTANLAKEDEDLALEVAKKQLEGLTDNNTVDFGDLNCDINQFADRCDTNDESELTSLGEDVKNLISNPQCNLPDFVASEILTSQDSDVANGYCEFVSRTEDNSRICTNYSMVLNDFKAGKLKQLPCPPLSCTSFKNIKPPRCVPTQSFCENENDDINCISKPKKDLFCLKVPDEIPESDCVDDDTANPDDIQPGWIVTSNSLGNQYCVPSNPEILSEIIISSEANSTPETIAEECEYNFCHKQCDEKTGTDAEGCHFNCDAIFGKIIDCTDGNSPYFSIQCCNSLTIKSRIKNSDVAYQVSGSVRPPNLAIVRGPVLPNIALCLCADSNNFNEVGYAYDESKLFCEDSCPTGYEKDSESGSCFPICPQGFVRDPNGFCKKECPSGFIKDASGICGCPSSLAPQISSETGILTCLCSDGSKPDANGKCLMKQHTCAVGEISNSVSSCTCAGTATKDTSGICQCLSGQTYSATGCTSTTNSTYCAIGQISTSANPCTCASGATVSSTGYCQCTNGQVYAAAGCPSSTTTYCSPGISISTGCTCNPAGGAYSYNGYCQCPSGNSQTYTKEYGCTSSTTQNYCSPGQISTSANPCTCASGATVSSTGYCQCTNGQTYAAAGCPAGSTTPTMPTALTATNSQTYSGIVNLTWTDNSSDEISFSIYRRQSGYTTWTQLTTVGTNITTYSDNSVTVGYTYEYKVNACNANGCSGDSNTASTSGGNSNTTYCAIGQISTAANPCTCASGATVSSAGYCQCTNGQAYAAAGCPAGSTTPAVPTALAANNSQTYSGIVNLTWTDNSSDETNFSIYRRQSGYTTWTLLTTVGTNITTYSDNSVTVGYTYEYKVNACNSYGCSGDSNTATITPTTVGGGGGSNNNSTPAVPTALAANNSQTYSGVVNLTWTDNSSDETSFSIYRRQSGYTTWTQLTTVGTNITTYADNSVTIGYTYEYKVNACNANGCSGDSNTATVTPTTIGNTPTAPTALSATSPYYSNGINHLYWTDNANNETSFSVYRRDYGTTTWTLITSSVSADTPYYSDNTATSGTTYEYKVNACNANGCSGDSNTTSVITN